MAQQHYLRYDAKLEKPRPDEAQTFKAIVDSIERTSATSTVAHGHGIRQQHAKGHGFLRGELQVYDDLPRHLRQGMFAVARSYDIIVRLSTAFGDLRSDRIRVPRGMAIKVLGVEGPKALADDQSSNQDFLLVNHKSYFADASAYLSAQRLFEMQPSFNDFLLRVSGLAARGLVSLARIGDFKLPMLLYALGDTGNNIIGETFYSEGALRFGDYVARLSAAPVSEAAVALTGKPDHAVTMSCEIQSLSSFGRIRRNMKFAPSSASIWTARPSRMLRSTGPRNSRPSNRSARSSFLRSRRTIRRGATTRRTSCRSTRGAASLTIALSGRSCGCARTPTRCRPVCGTKRINNSSSSRTISPSSRNRCATTRCAPRAPLTPALSRKRERGRYPSPACGTEGNATRFPGGGAKRRMRAGPHQPRRVPAAFRAGSRGSFGSRELASDCMAFRPRSRNAWAAT